MGAEKTPPRKGKLIPMFEVAGLVYLAAHLIAAVTGSVYLWGVDSWRVLPEWGAYILFALGATLFIPQVQDAISRNLRTTGHMVARVPAVVYVLAGGLLFWLVRCRSFFLGDGMLRMRNITAHFDRGHMFPLITYEEPLDTFIHSGLYNLLQPLADVSAQDIYQWVSIAAGMLAIWLLVRYERNLNESEHGYTALLVLTSGTVLLFFGYVESYAVAWVCALGALLAGLRMLQTGTVSFAAVVWFSFAMAIHPTVLTIAPGMAYVYLAGQTAKKKRPMVIAGASGIAGLVLGSTVLLMRIAGRTLDGFSDSAGGSHFLPFFASAGSYTVCSLAHIADMVNEVMLVLPAILVLFLGGWNIGGLVRSKRFRFLALSIIGPLVWLLVIDPKLGFARDWDLFSLMSLPGALIMAEILRGLPTERVRRTIIPIAGIALLHTVPWIALNASEEAALARFHDLAGTPHWSDDATAMAWESLASYLSAHERYSAAGDGYARAYDLTGNRRFYMNVIGMYQRSGEPDTLARFVHSHPDDAEGYAYLGELYFQYDHPEESAEALTKAVEIDPNVRDGYFNLGIALATLERYHEAIDAYTEALTHTGDDDTRALILTNRANARVALNEFPAAIVDYNAAIETAPSYGLPRFNLAFTYFRLGDMDTARRLLDEADSVGYSGDDVKRLRELME